MEETPPSASSQEPDTAPPAPVMDVTPPQPAAKAAPAPEPMATAPSDEDHPEPPMPPAHQKAPPKPKQPRSGVGGAIFATVIIVLGLAALAVYAYFKQNK